MQIPLSTIQRIGHTFQVTGSVARKAGSGRPNLTTRDDRRLKMTVLKKHKKPLAKLAQEFRNEAV